MTEKYISSKFESIPLTRSLAEEHATELAALASQIPEVEYTTEDILAENKGDRQLHNKWDHSLIVLEADRVVAFVMGYERQAEGNEQYPDDTLYLSELAVAEDYQGQGIARELLRQFFEMNNSVGFLSLSGRLNYTIQTNSAEWNSHVVTLYKSFGFEERARKKYPNRTDVVLGAPAEDIRL